MRLSEALQLEPEKEPKSYRLNEVMNMKPPDVEKAYKRGFGEQVQYFLGQTPKAIATAVETIPVGFENIVQAGETFIREIAKKQLAEDRNVFGISEEEFKNRTPEQRQRIAINTKILNNMDSAIETSKRLQKNWIDMTKTGIEAIDPELMRGTFTENPSFTRAWVMGLQSVPMLGLAAAVTYATKSPTMGASIFGAIESSEDFVKGIESGQSLESAIIGFTANLVMLTTLETIPLTGFMKGGRLPIRMFRGAIQEGGEEVLQALWRNSVAKIGYDETRKLTEGMVEGFLAGFLSGGVIGSFSPSNNVFETIKEAKENGVDVDKMQEAVSQQVMNNADAITENMLAQETSEAAESLKNKVLGDIVQQKPVEEAQGEQGVVKDDLLASAKKAVAGLKVEMIDVMDTPERARAVGMSPDKWKAMSDDIQKNGVKVPIIVDKESGMVLDGHTRLTIAESLGIKKVPVVYVDKSNMDKSDVDALNKQLTAAYEKAKGEVQSEVSKKIDIARQVKIKEPLHERMKNATMDVLSGGKAVLEDMGGIISTRALKISPKFKDRFIKFEFDTVKNKVAYDNQIKDFVNLNNPKSLGDDFNAVSFVLKNPSMSDERTQLLKKHGLEESYNKVREVLDDIKQKAENVGLDIGYIEDYFPREIRRDKLEEYLGKLRGKESFTLIEKAFESAQKAKGSVPLTDEERTIIVSQMLSGYGSRINIGSTNFTKSRKIENIEPEDLIYYKSDNEAIINYVSRMNAMIEARKFLGRDNKEVTSLIKKLATAEKRLVEINEKDAEEVKSKKIGQLYAILENMKESVSKIEDLNKVKDINEKVESLTEYLNFIVKIHPKAVKNIELKNLNEKIASLKESLSGYETNLETSISRFLLELLDDGIIQQKDFAEARKIIDAVVNPKNISNSMVSFLRDIGYISVMSDPTNGLVQFGDMFLSAYQTGTYETIVGFADVLRGKTTFDVKNIVGEVISKELQDFKSQDKFRNFMMKYVSLVAPIDKLGKATNIQANVIKMSNLAKKKNAGLMEELSRVFGDRDEQVRKDLANKVVTDDTSLMVFARLSDIQPNTASETPIGYQKGGNLKIFYTLKSYALKVLDIMRRDAIMKIAQGKIVEGLTNFIRLAFFLGLAGASYNSLRDFIFGRTIDLADNVMDGILQLAFTNKYLLDKGKREGYLTSFAKSQIPPVFKIIDDLQRDITKSVTDDRELVNWQTITDLPAGKLFYWWFGGGVEKKEKEEKRNSRNKLKRRK